MRVTPLIEPTGLAAAIEPTAFRYVSREVVDYATKSYAWSITFRNCFGDTYGEDHTVDKAEVPPLVPDGSGLRGVGAHVAVDVVNTIPPIVRGVTHAFTRDNFAPAWYVSCRRTENRALRVCLCPPPVPSKRTVTCRPLGRRRSNKYSVSRACERR